MLWPALFTVADRKQDGRVCTLGFMHLLRLVQGDAASEEELQRTAEVAMVQFDRSGSGGLSPEEFAAACSVVDLELMSPLP